MKILIASSQPFLPEITGGMQKSSDILARMLHDKGHDCQLLTALIGAGRFGWVARVKLKLSGGPIVRDNGLGYPVGRAWFPWQCVENLARKEKPDVIIIPCGKPVKMALEARKAGIPVVMWLQNVEFTDHGGDFADLGHIPCVANSSFTALKYHTAYGVDPVVIHPMIDGRRYRTETTRENVTFINPHPLKGLDIAVKVAEKCPDIPFSFIQTWTSSESEHKELKRKISGLPNVTLCPPVSDMRKVYQKARIVLAPSQWEEAYGRIATEAQYSGIPVIASNRGGLPEAVGQGGILLDPDGDIHHWVDAVQKLWHDPSYYHSLSDLAFAHANRPELDVGLQLETWENLLYDITGKPVERHA